MLNFIMRGFSELYGGSRTEALNHIERTLEYIEKDDVVNLAYCYLNAAVAKLVIGDMNEAQYILIMLSKYRNA